MVSRPVTGIPLSPGTTHVSPRTPCTDRTSLLVSPDPTRTRPRVRVPVWGGPISTNTRVAYWAATSGEERHSE